MTNYFTQKGFEVRLRQIKAQEQRVRDIGKEAGDAAGASCDWHDNFGYEDAKRRLEMECSNLQRLRDEISTAQLITVKEQSERISIGVTVEVSIDSKTKEFTIGACGESDPDTGLISYKTPLAKHLLKMELGDSKRINIGGKFLLIEIGAVHPPSYRYDALIENLKISR
jgi:transcription elongation GreA/GreB family factor